MATGITVIMIMKYAEPMSQSIPPDGLIRQNPRGEGVICIDCLNEYQRKNEEE